jgi:hypothetical protein
MILEYELEEMQEGTAIDCFPISRKVHGGTIGEHEECKSRFELASLSRKVTICSNLYSVKLLQIQDTVKACYNFLSFNLSSEMYSRSASNSARKACGKVICQMYFSARIRLTINSQL